MAKINPVTEEEWLACNEFNRMIVNEFLQQQHLSDFTLKQYKSAMSIFLRFIKDNLMNKPIYELKARDALKYQNWLLSLDLSSNAVKFKRSAVSTLCNYIELYYGEEYPNFRNIFNKAIPSPAKQLVKEKNIIPKEDFERLIKDLEEREEWQKIAYLKLSYVTGARRGEIENIKKEHFNVDKVNGKDIYKTPKLRGKGRGKQGKLVNLFYNDEARNAILKWLEIRGEDECEYVFVRKTKDGKVNRLSRDAFNDWFAKDFNKILGEDKGYAPHSLRRSRASDLVNDGKDIETARKILNHNDVSTTQIYVIRENEDDDLDDAF